MKVVLHAVEGEKHFGILEGTLPDLEIVRATSPDEAVALIKDADVFFGRPTHELLAAAERLRWIQAPSAGVEFVSSMPELVENDMLLTNTRGAHGPSIAEHVFGLLLAFTREIPVCLDLQRERRWVREKLYRSAREIMGSTMGIVGFGQIGRNIAQRAQGFELNLLAVDAQAVDGTPFVDSVWPTSRLGDLLVQSDIVVITVPLSDSSRNMIDANAIAKMKPDAYLIAISRGGIVNEEALAKALKSGHLAGAGLDVTVQEPLPPDNPLWDAPRLILTPHLAGASDPKERRVVEIFRDNLLRFAAGEPLINQVDKRLGY
ncbi:MAG TPA: D-2-hydroxyacid dehydrogenase [Thermomicrobiales bacterium]|nr:D-2-hydroxyacid dehydrogenase [Thermomicrobiales bacterium]